MTSKTFQCDSCVTVPYQSQTFEADVVHLQTLDAQSSRQLFLTSSIVILCFERHVSKDPFATKIII